jgi:hypothetical protein
VAGSREAIRSPMDLGRLGHVQLQAESLLVPARGFGAPLGANFPINTYDADTQRIYLTQVCQQITVQSVSHRTRNLRRLQTTYAADLVVAVSKIKKY